MIARQVDVLRRVWSGAALGEGIGAVGPAPARRGGPEILLGGAVPAVLRRVGRLADGFLSPASPAAVIEAQFSVVRAAWQEAGRKGAPRIVAPRYFALGDCAGRSRREHPHLLRPRWRRLCPGTAAEPVADPGCDSKQHRRACEDWRRRGLLLAHERRSASSGAPCAGHEVAAPMRADERRVAVETGANRLLRPHRRVVPHAPPRRRGVSMFDTRSPSPLLHRAYNVVGIPNRVC